MVKSGKRTPATALKRRGAGAVAKAVKSRKSPVKSVAQPGAGWAWAGPPRISLPKPLRLKDIGSFFINGKVVDSAMPDLSAPDQRGRIVVNQMYVEYFIPAGAKPGVPVIMVHGSSHTGMTYLTTPDGREGWATWFVRQGHPVYVVDQVGRARSGWDATRVHEARRQGRADLIPELGFLRITRERSFSSFHFGPAPDHWYPESRFPRAAIDDYLAQMVPNSEILLDDPRETVTALVALLKRTGPAILMVHSQSGALGVRTAGAAPELVRALVNVEGGASHTFSADDVRGLLHVPMLVVAGDYGWRGEPVLQPVVESVNQQGGNAVFFRPHEHGMPGHSHMLMMDEGNLKLAAWIRRWLGKNMKPAGKAVAQKVPASLPAPLTLKDAGAFFVNGKPAASGYVSLLAPITPGRQSVNQMYVEYLVPQVKNLKAPIVMVHGSNCSGAVYRTTPDGREGWATYFARRGHPVYLIDQVGRGRSGWDASSVNQARAQGTTERIPAAGFPRMSYEKAWSGGRLGPKVGEWWPDCAFAPDAMDGYMAHRMPNTETTLTNPRETVDALVKLLQKLGPSIVFVHSQGGAYGMQLAVTVPHLLRALVNLEGAGRSPVGPSTPEGLAEAFGDAALLHVIGGNVAGTAWEAGLAEARTLVKAFTDQGRKAEVLFAEEQGMPGHTHMMMMDRGNLELAGWIAKWLDRNAG